MNAVENQTGPVGPHLQRIVMFRAPTTLAEALASVAAERRTTVSAVIRSLLAEGLAVDAGTATGR